MPTPKGNLVTMTGFDSSGNLLAVLLDADGRLQVSNMPHDLLDGSIHQDTVARDPSEGDIILGVDVGAGVIKWDKLARGTTGQVLTAQADGSLAWADASGGDMILIGHSVQDGSQGSVDFTSISGTYRHLKLFYSARSNVAATGAQLYIQFNSDTGNNYDYVQSYFNNATTVGNVPGAAQTAGIIGAMAGNTATAGDVGTGHTLITNYRGTTFNKGWTGTSFYTDTRLAATLYNQFSGGQWRSTSAITSIRLSLAGGSLFMNGSIFSLYGMN